MEHHRVIADEVGEERAPDRPHRGCGEADFALGKREAFPCSCRSTTARGTWTAWCVHRSGGARRRRRRRRRARRTGAPLPRRAVHAPLPGVRWRCHEEIVFRVDDEWFLAMDEIRPKLKTRRRGQLGPRLRGEADGGLAPQHGRLEHLAEALLGPPAFSTPARGSTFFVIGSAEEFRERATSGLEVARAPPAVDRRGRRLPGGGADARRVKEVGDRWLDAGIVPFSTLDWLHDKAGWEKWFPAELSRDARADQALVLPSQLFFSVVLTGRAPYRNVLRSRSLDEGGARCTARGQRHRLPPRRPRRSAPTRCAGCSAGRTSRRTSFRLRPARPGEAAPPHALEHLPSSSRTRTSTGSTRTIRCRSRRAGRSTAGSSRGSPARPRGQRRASRRTSSGPALAIERFWDELSTGTSALSRRRFWKSTADLDKRAAEHTLYEVLTTLARLLAPYMPFLSEAMYQNLERGAGRRGAAASVHHTAWPEPDASVIDEPLERAMAAAMRVVSLGRSARGRAGIKVRTPLRRAYVVYAIGDRDRGLLDDDSGLLSVVRDELNVKAVEFVRRSRTSCAVVRPNLRSSVRAREQHARLSCAGRGPLHAHGRRTALG